MSAVSICSVKKVCGNVGFGRPNSEFQGSAEFRRLRLLGESHLIC